MQRKSRQSGASLVEFVLVLPLLIALIFFMIDFTFPVATYLALTHAAREGLRALEPAGATEEDVRDRIVSQARGACVSEMEIEINGIDARDGREVSVIIRAIYRAPLGIFIKDRPMGVIAVGRKE